MSEPCANCGVRHRVNSRCFNTAARAEARMTEVQARALRGDRAIEHRSARARLDARILQLFVPGTRLYSVEVAKRTSTSYALAAQALRRLKARGDLVADPREPSPLSGTGRVYYRLPEVA